MSAGPVALAEAFVRAISSQKVDAIAGLMAPEHTFIDSDGSAIRGKERMRAAWAQYFQMFPDYRIEVEETYSRGPVVILVGSAEGTYAVGGELLAENHWRVPAVWRAVTGEDAILEWRIYVNVEPVVKIVMKHQK
jgi:ketosteroid isomerase-like protein